jgi:hypothetical protein
MAITRSPEEDGSAADAQYRFQAKHPSESRPHGGEGSPCLSNDDKQHVHREQGKKTGDGYFTEVCEKSFQTFVLRLLFPPSGILRPF